MVTIHFPDQFKSVMMTPNNTRKIDFNDYIHSEGCLVSTPLAYLKFNQYLMAFADFCQQTVVT